MTNEFVTYTLGSINIIPQKTHHWNSEFHRSLPTNCSANIYSPHRWLTDFHRQQRTRECIKIPFCTSFWFCWFLIPCTHAPCAYLMNSNKTCTDASFVVASTPFMGGPLEAETTVKLLCEFVWCAKEYTENPIMPASINTVAMQTAHREWGKRFCTIELWYK